MTRIPINTRVRLHIPGVPHVYFGKVAGVAWETAIIYGMIILLDAPLDLPDMMGWTAVCATPDMVTTIT